MALLDSAARLSQTHYLAGRVCDEGSGSPVSGAQVNLMDTNFGAITDSAGIYRIQGVPRGTYHVRFRRIGYYAEIRQAPVSGGCGGIQRVDQFGKPIGECPRGDWLNFSVRSANTF